MTVLKGSVLVLSVTLAGILLTSPMQPGRVQVVAQSGAGDHAAVKEFAGTWNWMFEDKRFATMTLNQDGDQLTGSMTNAHIDFDERGKISAATAAKGTTPIVKATMHDGKLILLARDGEDETEFAMTLTSSSTAELRLYGDRAPQNAQPIQLEKVWSEPPLDK
jgi:hypothetical protein